MTCNQRSFVGFGFGAIQSGLFLLEAARSGNFNRYVVAEVDARLVAALRANNGACTINVAHRNRIEQVTLGGVEILNPAEPADRECLLQAIATAKELATALPSVEFYDRGGASVASLLADGLARRQGNTPAIIYTAENHNHAAEILVQQIQRHSAEALRNVQILNTVIGKMSGVITDPQEIGNLGLAPVTPGADRAILVESFNRILISAITLEGFERGIRVFEEKPDLLPFEEAKLYGHNAVHAMLGYLAHQRGLATMAQLSDHPDLMAMGQSALLNETGAALVRKFGALGDPLFTAPGYSQYAADLLQRMVNPNLNDRVIRVIRDPQRKLGWSDRLFGAMRLALQQGITPVCLARGAAAAVQFHLSESPRDQEHLAEILAKLWAGQQSEEMARQLIELTWKSF